MFELDSTLITSTYKKHHMFGGYDASTYVKPIQGQNSKFKLYISYRSYMVDMLTQLKQELNEDDEESFELIVFSAKHPLPVLDQIVEAIERSCSNSKDRERIFDHLIGSDELMHLTDIDFHVLDLNVLLPPPPPPPVVTKMQTEVERGAKKDQIAGPAKQMKMKDSQKGLPMLTFTLHQPATA